MKREEAIEIIRKNMPSDKSLPVYEALHSLIPELTESEDERIRKEIVSIVQSYRDSCISEGTHRFDDCLAWLEKQKHTAPNEYDEKMRKKIIDHLESIKMGCVICTIDTSEEIAWLEKQKEQPLGDFIEDFPYSVEKEQKPADLSEMMVHKEPYIAPVPTPMVADEQKPAEWSEEDEEMLDIVLDMVDCSTVVPHPGGQLRLSDNYKKDISNWLKSLRPQPKQEWNDEDIKKIRSEEYTKGFNDAAFVGKIKEWSVEDEYRIRQIERIAQEAGCTQKLQEEIHDWLKSLRPSWKPSEHQMNILKAVKDYVGKGSGYWGEGLGSLIDDLEKLM